MYNVDRVVDVVHLHHSAWSSLVAQACILALAKSFVPYIAPLQ